ncbi:unnamed protein product [Cunninghamella blakesleeana]
MMEIEQHDSLLLPIMPTTAVTAVTAATMIHDPNNKSNSIPEFVRKLFSFVRQLNKYDFHKIRGQQSTSPFGIQAWEFKHIHFKCHRKDLIYKIKRKPTKKSNKKKEISLPHHFHHHNDINNNNNNNNNNKNNKNNNRIDESTNDYLENISQQLHDTQQSYLTLTSRLEKMVQNYQSAVETVIFYKNSLKTQDELIQKMISTTLSKRNDPIVNNTIYSFIQSYQVLTKKEDEKLTEIIQHTKENQHLLTTSIVTPNNQSINHINQEKQLTIIPSHPKWEYSPRVLLIFFNHQHHQDYYSQLFQWVQALGCRIDTLYFSHNDTDTVMTLKTGLLIKKSFDMLFIMSDGLLNAKKITLLNMIRQKDLWLPIIDNSASLMEPENYWLKQGVTEIIPSFMVRKQLDQIICKYCSHLRLK